MFSPCKPVNLCQNDDGQLRAELEALCAKTSGPLRLEVVDVPGSPAGTTTSCVFIRERTLGEAVYEDIGDFFGFACKREAVNRSLAVLAKWLPRTRVDARNDVKANAATNGATSSRCPSQGGGTPSGPFSKSLSRSLFARVMGGKVDELAKGLPKERICNELIALREDLSYQGKAVNRLTLSRHVASPTLTARPCSYA